MPFGAPLLLWVLLVAAVLLLALTQLSFKQIRRTDAALFERLGRPDLFKNNNYSNVMLYWKWVFGESMKKAPPSSLRPVLWLIRGSTVAYVSGLILFFLQHF